jgi:hypothetical protein
MNYKISIALLSGTGFASLLILLLNLPFSPVPLLALSLLVPGALPVAFFWKSTEFGPPLAVLAANALVYSAIAFTLLAACFPKVSALTFRWLAMRLVAPVLSVLCLACVPAFNPLWPQGMMELERQENALQAELPLGVKIEVARAVLRSRGIDFNEHIETSPRLVLTRAKESIAAERGDRVISARFATDASEFVCGYDMEIVILFGRDDRLKQQYVRRLRLCP